MPKEDRSFEYGSSRWATKKKLKKILNHGL